MFKKQQGTSRAFMVEDDAPKRRKFTRKTTNNSGRDSGHTGDVGLLYDDSLYLQDDEVSKTLDSIIKSLEGEKVAPSEVHDAFHAINDFLEKEEKFPRVGCMAGYHDHPGTKGCHPVDKPHRGEVITNMGGSAAYERVHPQITPKDYGG